MNCCMDGILLENAHGAGELRRPPAGEEMDGGLEHEPMMMMIRKAQILPDLPIFRMAWIDTEMMADKK